MKGSKGKTGILVHGRHLKSLAWEKLALGFPEKGKLGVLSKLVYVVLTLGLENISTIVFGTGASEKDGLKESQYTKRFLLENLGKLSEFECIKNHPRFQSTADLVRLKEILQDIICDVESQNTNEEVKNAARCFSERGAEQVIQITCGSHAPRCVLTQLIVRAEGLIPLNQLWSVVGDDMTFTDSRIEQVAIFEWPHRGDDPACNWVVKTPEVFPLFFKIPADRREEVLLKIQEVIKTNI